MNSKFCERLKEKGLVFSGLAPENQEKNEDKQTHKSNGTFLGFEAPRLPEILELPTQTHPWFLGVQFHPELKSRPFKPHPIFKSFVNAANKHGKSV